MPLRQELAASQEQPEEQPDPGPAEVSETVDEPLPRKGWFRRRVKPTEPEPVSEATDEDAESGDVPAEEQILVAHRPAGKRLTVAAVAAAAVFVGAAAFAGATLQPYLADRALVNTKLDIARTAANAISTLWTYTPDNMDKLPDRSAGYLGGDFANEYRKYIDAIVASNKQAQVTNTTEVMGTAVETVTPSEATALVYTNSVATSPVSKNIPSLRYLSYRLTLQRHDAKWLITRMSTVTSFDLTPQL
jgi:Mce-associated membrane protein